jgi:hypothetical protein
MDSFKRDIKKEDDLKILHEKVKIYFPGSSCSKIIDTDEGLLIITASFVGDKEAKFWIELESLIRTYGFYFELVPHINNVTLVIIYDYSRN